MRCSPYLASVLLVGLAIPASAQMMKEGTFDGTYSSSGTVKANAVGKERLLAAFDETGLTVGQGFVDHITWHCFGLGDFTNGMGQYHGYCMGIDPAGDQLVHNFSDSEKHPPDQKSWTGSFTWTTGTGKFTGISGTGAYELHGNEFRPLSEGTYVQFGTIHANYKLP
jgi:hypothetical protein